MDFDFLVITILWGLAAAINLINGKMRRAGWCGVAVIACILLGFWA